MAIIIAKEFINWKACEPEWPNNVIYDPGAAWRFSDDNELIGIIDLVDGDTLNTEETQAALSVEIYYYTTR